MKKFRQKLWSGVESQGGFIIDENIIVPQSSTPNSFTRRKRGHFDKMHDTKNFCVKVLSSALKFELCNTILTSVRFCVTLMLSLEGKGVFEVHEIMLYL